MGLIALPVSPHGLSAFGQAEEAESEEQATPALDALKALLRKLQQLLSVPVTGEFDTATQDAVKSVQWAHNLPQTGNPLDPDTKAVLEQVGADLSSLTPTEYVKIRVQVWWTQYKWWVVGGAAVAVIGGGLLYATRSKR